MKRDLNDLRRIRKAVTLIRRAVADGWRRDVCVLKSGAQGRAVTVALECYKRGGCNGRIVLHFYRTRDGQYHQTAFSRFLAPRGHQRDGLPQAWAVFNSLKEVAS